MKIRIENSARLATAALAAVTMLAVAAPASAAFSKDELKCRQTIAKETAKLAKTIGKTLTGCHKSRQKGKVMAGNDCNDVNAPETDPKGKVAKTVGKMTDKIADPVKGKCTPLAPGSMGYFQCPAPCDVTVPTIAAASDVAACLACVTESEVSAMVAAAQDSPAPPLGKDDAKCHATIGKEQTKHLNKALKERPKCQNAAESAGATSIDPACEGSLQKIDDARTKGEGKITGTCGAPVDLNNVNSCSTIDTASLNACVFDDSDVEGLTLFNTMYALGSPTWTAVQNLFITTGCTSGFCHGNSPGGGNLGDLGDYDLGYDELLIEGVDCLGSAFTQRVVTGDAANSFLYAKLAGTWDCGGPMPAVGSPFTPEQLAIVEGWILDGAQKN